ncbi:MAG: phosphotransferase [Aeriscardovia sp.]|nr:phosphotransferase [Aeriscardovia sp.]
MNNRNPYLLAALASAVAPNLKIVSVSLTNDLPRVDEGKDIMTGILLLQNGDDYNVSIGTSEQANHLLQRRAQNVKALSLNTALIHRLGFHIEQLSVIGDVKTDEGTKTVFITPRLEGFPIPFESLDTSLCASMGTALAKIHRLDTSHLIEKGYQTFNGDAIRSELSVWVDRLIKQHDVPRSITRRWKEMLGVDSMWDFHACLIHGNFMDNDTLFLDSGVSAIRNWERLQISDPARDFAWLYTDSITDAQRDAVLSEYGHMMGSHMDSRIVPRARLWRQMGIVTDFLRSLDSMDQVWINQARYRIEALSSTLSPVTAVTSNNSVNATPSGLFSDHKVETNSTVTVSALFGTSSHAGKIHADSQAHVSHEDKEEPQTRVIQQHASQKTKPAVVEDEYPQQKEAPIASTYVAPAISQPQATPQMQADSQQPVPEKMTSEPSQSDNQKPVEYEPEEQQTSQPQQPANPFESPDPKLAAILLQTFARAAIANKKGIDLKKQQDTAKPQVPQDDQETNVFSASSFAQSKEDSLHASIHLSNTSSVKERLDQAKKLMLNIPSVSSDDSMVTSQTTDIPTTIFKKN